MSLFSLRLSLRLCVFAREITVIPERETAPLASTAGEHATQGRVSLDRHSTSERSSDRERLPDESSSAVVVRVHPSSTQTLERCTSAAFDPLPQFPTLPAHTTLRNRYSPSIAMVDCPLSPA